MTTTRSFSTAARGTGTHVVLSTHAATTNHLTNESKEDSQDQRMNAQNLGASSPAAPLTRESNGANDAGLARASGTLDADQNEKPTKRRPVLNGAEAIAMSEIEARPVSWLWRGRIPLGSLTVLAGDPGLGKSLLTCRLAAAVSNGELGEEPAETLLLTAEDSLEATVKPRLDAAGADSNRVRVVRMRRDGISGGLAFPDDLEELRRVVIGSEARLLVIDPFVAHLQGTVNSWHDQSVRRALAPIYQLAEEAGTAILLVVHLNKTGEGDVLKRLGGSIGLPAAARSVLLLARDPDDPDGEQGSRRVLAHIKSNVGGYAPSLLYEIESVRLPGQVPIETARLQPLGETTLQGSDLLVPSGGGGRRALGEAVEFLEAELAEGPRPAKELLRLAEGEGISSPTLKRAKKQLEVVSEKLAFDEGWGWSLPGSGAPEGDQSVPTDVGELVPPDEQVPL